MFCIVAPLFLVSPSAKFSDYSPDFLYFLWHLLQPRNDYSYLSALTVNEVNVLSPAEV